MKRVKKIVEELGFEQGEYGELIANGCRIIFYQVGDEYEVGDIITPTGMRIGFVIPGGLSK